MKNPKLLILYVSVVTIMIAIDVGTALYKHHLRLKEIREAQKTA